METDKVLFHMMSRDFGSSHKVHPDNIDEGKSVGPSDHCCNQILGVVLYPTVGSASIQEMSFCNDLERHIGSTADPAQPRNIFLQPSAETYRFSC